MKLGALLGPVDPGNMHSLADQARALEAAGFESLWSAHATGRGFMISDPFVALTVAATVTEKVELGIAILQLPLYEAVDIALKTFSLMQVSGNRFSLGLGAGSTEVDHQIHRSDFQLRFRVFNEKLAELRAWLRHGEFNGHSINPWPAVRGGPPMIYGTWGKGVARAANEFDGWVTSGMHRTVEDVEQTIPAYRAAGGQRAIVSTILLSAKTDLGEFRERMSRYAAAGFDDAVVMFTPGAPSPAEVRSTVR